MRDDLARAWAEVPVLLGFGQCAATYRTRWFAVARGLAAIFKLTALASPSTPTIKEPGASW